MYIPKLYRQEDRREILTFLRQNNFAALVSFDGQKPLATHAPVDVVEAADGSLTVFGHIARANPQWRSFNGQEVLLIFQGAHTYISPRWYNHVNVPTWDYMIAHLYGTVRPVEGPELVALLSRLVQKHEAASTYRLEGLPEDFAQKQIQAIIGFAVQVTRLEASYKLSQNRDDGSFQNVILELDKRADDDSHRIAEAMRRIGGASGAEPDAGQK